MIKNIKISLKNLFRNGLQSLLGILSFAAGFSVCIIIGLYLYNESTVDTQSPNHHRIYRLVSSTDLNTMIDYKFDDLLLNQYAAIENCTPVHMEHDWKYDVYIDGKSTFVSGLMPTTNRFFEMFSIPVLRSISTKPFSDKCTAILTSSTARSLFGDEDALGKNLRILETETTISAIIPDFPKESSFHANVLLNAEHPEFRLFSISSGEYQHDFTSHYILLRDGYSYKDLENQINARIIEYPVFNSGEISLQSLKDIYLNVEIADKNKHGNILLIQILIAIGAIMLVLSIINYFNYTVSNQLKQIKDIGIKKVQGAFNYQILIFYMIDIFIWLIISLLVAIIFVGLSIPYINQYFTEQLHLQSLIETPFILSGFLVFVLVFMLSSIPLFFILSKFNVVDALKGKTQLGSYGRGKGYLTVFQLFVTIVLIFGLIVIRKQVHFAKHRDLGFEKENLLHIKVPYHTFNPESFKKEISKFSGISNVSITNGVPGKKMPTLSLENSDKSFLIMDVDREFLETMQIELQAGRNFLENEKQVCLVNQSLINHFEIEDFEKEKLSGLEIVGVVENFNLGSIHHQISPLVITHNSCTDDISIRISEKETERTIKFVESEWKKFAGETPLEISFYDQKFDAMYTKEEILARVAFILSFIAIAISCFGLIGQILIVSFSKTKEISIRKINGASVAQIVLLLNFNFIKWLLIAFIIAIPVSYFVMSQWLQNFAFKTNLSWWIFLLSGIIVMILLFVTVSWYSLSAAIKNPVDTLRNE